MKKAFLSSLSTLIVFVFFLSSCSKDEPGDPIIPNEEEVITTLKYILIPNGGGDTLVFSFQDLDGDGGNAPIILDDVLDANTTYTGTLLLLNELKNPAEDITVEIKEEATEHQLFYQTDLNGVDITYQDLDDNSKPIGLATRLSTLGAGTGTLTITLRHQPDKNATGVVAGDISNAGGETDIEVSFNVEVK